VTVELTTTIGGEAGRAAIGDDVEDGAVGSIDKSYLKMYIKSTS